MLKAYLRIFVHGLRQIGRDGMVAVLVPAPFLMAGALRLLLPLADAFTTERWNFPLRPWYVLSDAGVLCLAPLVAALVASFLLLDEADSGAVAYYQITPARGAVFLAARLGPPLAWAFLSGVAAAGWLSLTRPAWPLILTASAQSTVTGFGLAMLIVALAGNKVEGLALSKLSGVFILGLPWSFFAPPDAAWIGWAFPSYWLAEWLRSGPNPASLAAGWLVAFAWAAAFARAGLKRLDRPAA